MLPHFQSTPFGDLCDPFGVAHKVGNGQKGQVKILTLITQKWQITTKHWWQRQNLCKNRFKKGGLAV